MTIVDSQVGEYGRGFSDSQFSCLRTQCLSGCYCMAMPKHLELQFHCSKLAVQGDNAVVLKETPVCAGPHHCETGGCDVKEYRISGLLPLIFSVGHYTHWLIQLRTHQNNCLDQGT